jgi:hypothetical protein
VVGNTTWVANINTKKSVTGFGNNNEWNGWGAQLVEQKHFDQG